MVSFSFHYFCSLLMYIIFFAMKKKTNNIFFAYFLFVDDSRDVLTHI